MLLSADVERQVVVRLFADADRLGWANLTVVERSAQYATWVADANVGGLLAEFMSASKARVWIKDGPMKELARARFGIGKYAPLMPGGAQRPEQLVHMALGDSWEAEADSLCIKPLRVRASQEDDEVIFAWGPERDFKHLLWAALKASANGDPVPWMLCIVDSFTKPVPANIRQVQLRMAERCKIQLVYITV